MNFPHFINVLYIHLVWCFIQEGASLGDHLGHGLLQLGALLHQVDDPLVQTRPVASFEGELYDCDKHPRCAVRVRS